MLDWWDGYATTGQIMAQTRETYAYSLRVLVQTCGFDDAATMTSARVVQIMDELADSGASARTVNKHLTVLGSAFTWGVEQGLVPANPTRGVRRRPEQRAPLVIPTPTDVEWLRRTAPTVREQLMLAIATGAGLRQGELLALEWRHVGANGLHIEQVAERGGKIRVGTKTGRSRRVPVPRSLATLLEEHRQPHGLVIEGPRGKPVDRDNWRERVYGRWRRDAVWQAAAAGDEWDRIIDLRWRHLRHYYVSRLVAVGATVVEAARYAGHGSSRTTIDVYGALWAGNESAVMDALDQLG